MARRFEAFNGRLIYIGDGLWIDTVRPRSLDDTQVDRLVARAERRKHHEKG